MMYEQELPSSIIIQINNIRYSFFIIGYVDNWKMFIKLKKLVLFV